MKSILTLVLLSMFMAMPSYATRYFVDSIKVVATSSPAPTDMYYWGIYKASDTGFEVPELQNTTILPETTVVPTVGRPYGRIFKLRVWPGTSSPLTIGITPSELSEDAAIYEDFDFNKNGLIGAGEIASAAASFVTQGKTLAYVNRAAKMFGKCVVRGEYVDMVNPQAPTIKEACPQ